MIVLMVLRHDLKLTPRAEAESRREGEWESGRDSKLESEA